MVLIRDKRALLNKVFDLEGRSKELSERAVRNNQNLIDKLVISDEVYDFVSDPLRAKTELFKRLLRIPHTKRTVHGSDFYEYEQDPKEVYNLSLRQLVRINLLMNELQDERFLRQIGGLMVNALEAEEEHGGIMTLTYRRKIELNNLENQIKGGSKYNYKWPQEALDTSHLATYHFHAGKEDSSPLAGPSKGIPPVFPGDLAVCDSEILNHGESHNIVFTSLPEKKVSVDYYGGERIGAKIIGKNPITVVDLGDYSYDL